MSKKIDKIREFFQKQSDECRTIMEKLEVRRKDVSFSYWAGWNAMEYINAEMTATLFETLQGSLSKLENDGKTDEEIIQWVGECRDQMVEDVLKARKRTSTNQLDNLIEAEKMDVYRKVAGCGLFDSGSLAYLLMDLKRI